MKAPTKWISLFLIIFIVGGCGTKSQGPDEDSDDPQGTIIGNPSPPEGVLTITADGVPAYEGNVFHDGTAIITALDKEGNPQETVSRRVTYTTRLSEVGIEQQFDLEATFSDGTELKVRFVLDGQYDVIHSIVSGAGGEEVIIEFRPRGPEVAVNRLIDAVCRATANFCDLDLTYPACLKAMEGEAGKKIWDNFGLTGFEDLLTTADVRTGIADGTYFVSDVNLDVCTSDLLNNSLYYIDVCPEIISGSFANAEKIITEDLACSGVLMSCNVSFKERWTIRDRIQSLTPDETTSAFETGCESLKTYIEETFIEGLLCSIGADPRFAEDPEIETEIDNLISANGGQVVCPAQGRRDEVWIVP